LVAILLVIAVTVALSMTGRIDLGVKEDLDSGADAVEVAASENSGDAKGSDDADQRADGNEPALPFTEQDGSQPSPAGTSGSATSSAEASASVLPAPAGESPGPREGDGAPQPDTSVPVADVVTVSGYVYHEVWGHPLSPVAISITPGSARAVTGRTGHYSVAGLPAEGNAFVRVDGINSAWLSHDPTSRFVPLTDGDRSVSFGIYMTEEAYGRRWPSATDWRSVPDSTLRPLVARVAAGSTEFDGLTLGQARAILRDSKNGSPQERARAELLGTWLSMASGKLGFDTAVDITCVPGASGCIGSEPGSVLALARAADRGFVSGQALDWNRMRRTLSDRVLVAGSSDQGSRPLADDEDDSGKGKGKGHQKR
jgi:hypothetical protein